MHYPWWHVPIITAPMLIAAVAVVHIYVAMYAVGGGLFLAVENQYARKSGNQDYLAYLKHHAWFFILLTVVFGAITGVGIWWTIGLASPLATEALIHTFVFGWAMEYVFFVLEIASAFIFYYYWDKLPVKTHITVGWIYGISAWISLVLISAITAFMLNPGAWVHTHDFWAGFFNPEFWPQTIARTGGSLLLASLYVYLHAAFSKNKHHPDLLTLISRRSTRPGLLGAALVTIGGIWWFIALPESAKATLAAASMLNVMMGIILSVTIVVFVMLYLGPHRHPEWITPGFAMLLFSFGLAAIGTGEFIREAVRKPYIVYDVVYSSQMYKDELATVRENGFLESGVWTRAYMQEHYPQLVDAQGHIDEAALLDLPREDQIQVGGLMFQYHCNDCHAIDTGMSAIAELTRGWTPDMVRTVVIAPDKTRFFMPPFAGTEEEADLLTEYLLSVSKPFPAGLEAEGGR